MQDPSSHQTDIDSVIHQDDTGTLPETALVAAPVESERESRKAKSENGKTKVVAHGNGQSARRNNAPGLTIERRYTKPGEDVYGTVEWELRDAVISNERGEKVFEQKNVEIPKTWTQLATNVVVSKYFRGHIGTPQRETSVRQLIGRVADTMADWGRNMDYFATEEDAQAFQDELTHILLHQKAAFNSPVWFNVGLKDQPQPQCSACFINSVEDTMESILTLAKTEGMLFKFGSGTGTNLSPIRGSNEKLRGGGTASGPLSFMRGFDQFAGAIKSGGKCFRAKTLIATPDGWVPIETLQVGDPVLTHRGPRRVADFMPNGWKQCYRVKTEEGYEIEVTRGHKFAYWDANAGQFCVKPIEAFAPGEALYLLLEASEGGTPIPLVTPEAHDPANATTTAEMRMPTELNDELAYILGLMYGDGELRTEYPYRVRVAFCKDPAGELSLARFREYGERLFGEAPIQLSDETNHRQVGYTRKRLIEFLAANGLAKGKAHSLGFPTMLFQARPEVRAAFLAGFIDADGTYQKRGGWSISGIDRAFLVQLQRLLLTLGVPSKLRVSRESKDNWQELYRLSIVGSTFIQKLVTRISRHSAKAALNYVPSDGTDKGWGYRPSLHDPLRARLEKRGGYVLMERKIGLNETTGYRGLTALMEHPHASIAAYAEEFSHCVQITLQSVEPTEVAETYDIEVEDVHLLGANGFYASNTRRAAKMNLLDVNHPDIEQFITCKADEEKKAWALIDAGYSGMFNVPGGAYDSILFQNANNSVRVTDEFMRAYEQDADWTTRNVLDGKPNRTVKARDLMRKIGDSAWVCGDPGMQYDTTINKWHTCKNTDRIYASNPCCVTGDTLVAVADGRNAVAIKDLVGTEVPVYAHDLAIGRTTVSRMWNIGVKRQNAAVYRVTLDDGSSFRATDDHLIMQRDGSYRMVRDLKPGDSLMPFHSKVLTPAKNRTKRRFYWGGHSWQPQYRAVWQYINGAQPAGHHIHHRDFDALNDRPENLTLLTAAEHNALHGDKMRGDNNPARRLMSETWRQHISEAVSGEGNPHFGHKHSDTALAAMRAKAAQRWNDPTERVRSGQSVRTALQQAKAEGRPVGRPRGERYERCCPVCRNNFETARVEQIFCGSDCRYSPMGRQMSGQKTAAQNRGRALSEAHRAQLSVSVSAASDPETKRRAALTGHRNTILKAARLLLDAGEDISLPAWNILRNRAYALGAERVPTASTVTKHFASEAELCEAALLYNHKVTSVEFCGYEDVYDGTVDRHHNFAILTSASDSCASDHQNYSGLFIHNSEFVFLNDTACNLSSINLMKFRTEDGEFDPEGFQYACRILITAQEIIVSNASYPTPRIEENSHDYRPLGLGYANLGALLMARGVPYDSDAGRAYAGAITAIMTGEGYHQSALIARDHGWAFPGYQKNREPFLDVMRMHRASVEEINPEFVPDDMLQAARKSWDNAISYGEHHGYRNAQATVLAPTGTISFLMDCDTTGIEPDIAIVKYKNLVGGGMMKIVNNTVPEALRRLGYNPAQVDDILAYIDRHDTIEGAPELKPEHLPVFDCAFKPGNGVRSIHYMGHVRMMAAAQPFISGAISKTVNMPHEATTEEIMGVYVEGWKLGLKAIAIYRDGSKRTQPLMTKKADEKPEEVAEAVAIPETIASEVKTIVVNKPLRRKLPDERNALTHKFSIAGHEGYITVGMYPEGTPGEIFLTMSKEGSTISGLMDSFATAISLALQYGVPLQTLVDKFAHSRFEPSGITNNPDIRFAKSIMDYIFRYLGSKFLSRVPEESQPTLSNGNGGNGSNGHTGEATETNDLSAPSRPLLTMTSTESGAQTFTLQEQEQETFQNQSDAPICTECGSLMVRNGACYKCLNCGSVFGCS